GADAARCHRLRTGRRRRASRAGRRRRQSSRTGRRDGRRTGDRILVRPAAAVRGVPGGDVMTGHGQFLPILILAATLVFAAFRLRRRAATRTPTAPPERSLAAPAFTGVVGLIAEREVRQRLRGRVFRVATLVLLIGVAAAVVIPVVTKGKAQAQQV